jgi:predicted transposase/invertase (TIGR01784 family)
MYLAPLNYDKYFNKVFSNERIAKRFLEDFLETEVNELEMLKGKLRVTDNASLVEFDFRCKIDNSFVILDMQQWYKRDISQRFYLYHALNTGLQLEKLPSKRVLYDYSYEKNKKVKDYRALLPVLTLVWMADDSLDLKDDFVAYSMSPEIVVKFVKNKKLWHKPEIVELLKERARLLEVLDNQTKELQFLAKNRLIFMLQKNTVKNKNKEKYVKWFEFAEKTKNTDNKKEDFQEYLDDEIFCEMMKRLSKDTLTDDDFFYIQNEKTFWEEVERFEQGIYEVAWNEGEAKGEAKGEKNKALEIARRLKEKGFDDDLIADISGLPPGELGRL